MGKPARKHQPPIRMAISTDSLFRHLTGKPGLWSLDSFGLIKRGRLRELSGDALLKHRFWYRLSTGKAINGPLECRITDLITDDAAVLAPGHLFKLHNEPGNV